MEEHDCCIGEAREDICSECFKGESHCICPPPVDYCNECGEFEDECICGCAVCCRCHEVRSLEGMAVKHCSGELECVDCYGKSLKK